MAHSRGNSARDRVEFGNRREVLSNVPFDFSVGAPCEPHRGGKLDENTHRGAERQPQSCNSMLTLREAADVVRCSKAHLSNVIGGKIPGLPAPPVIRIGRRLLIRHDALIAWLKDVER